MLDYPPEYNRKVHGPFDPARWYGKPDTLLRDVKLADLGSWFARRNYSPSAIYRAYIRGLFSWKHKFVFSRRANLVASLHVVLTSVTFFYFYRYSAIRAGRKYKYH